MQGPISVEKLKHHVQKLNFDRDPYGNCDGLEKAAQYIEKTLMEIGMEVRADPVEWNGRVFRNIVAEKKGLTLPGQVLIIGAHYDTVPGSPGADDNASAVAVLLEVARSVYSIPLNHTVRFIAFTLEEDGYVGSIHYVRMAKTKRERILGMLSLEMVGFIGTEQNYPSYVDPKSYPQVGDFIGIIGNERSKGLLEKVRQSFKASVPRLPLEYLLVPGNGEGMEEVRLSDHSPFWDHGFPALMITDTAFLRNPNYHLPSDLIETLDFEFMQKVATGVSHSVVELVR